MIKRKRQGNIIKDNVYKFFEYYAVKIVYSTDAHRRRARTAHTLNTTGQTFVLHTVFRVQLLYTYLCIYVFHEVLPRLSVFNNLFSVAVRTTRSDSELRLFCLIAIAIFL